MIENLAFLRLFGLLDLAKWQPWRAHPPSNMTSLPTATAAAAGFTRIASSIG